MRKRFGTQRRRSTAPTCSEVAFIAERLEARRLLSTSVLTWHNDLARTGLNSTETQLTPTNVNQAGFGKLLSYPVDGQIYAQPLYVSNLTIPGKGTHDVIFVATETDNVYAFDADSSGASGGLLWKMNLGKPAVLPNPVIYPPGERYGPNIGPYYGITGTPVIDLASKRLYVDAFTDDGNGAYSHNIHALDITTGQDAVTAMRVAATVAGNGVGGDGSGLGGSEGTTVIFHAERELQRPALALVNGEVYVAYGSFSDGDFYHGWVLGFDAASLQLQSVFNDTPNLLSTPADPHADEGAFWAAGAAPSSDGSNLYLMSGNGDFDASIGDYGDSFIKLDSTNALALSDYFTPSNQAQLSAADQDLGSAGPMVLPDSVGSAAHPHLLIGCGKQGLIYLIDQTKMGSYDPNADHVIQEVSLGSGTWSNPAYFNGRVYFHGQNDVLKAFSISNGVLSTQPVAQSGVQYGYPGATPVISANGTSGGIVWDLQGGGVLHAYDATTLKELYNSNQAGSRDQLGSYENFTLPAEADGKVFVGTGNSVVVFGLFPAPTAPPAAPSNLIAAQNFGAAVSLTWNNNANNELSFQVERSTDGTNFTTIGTAPGVALGATAAFTDTSVSVGQTYYYRVRAYNLFNGGSLSNPSNAVSLTLTAPKSVFTDTYSADTTANYTESVESGIQDSWKVSGGKLNYSISVNSGWHSSMFLLNPSIANTAGLPRFTTSGDIFAPHTYQPGLVLTGDTSSGGFVVQEYNNGQYANHLVLLRETGSQFVGDEGGTGNPPVLADFGDISQHFGDTFHVAGAVDRTGAHPVITVSITDLSSPVLAIPTKTVVDSGDPANFGGTQIGWRARWQDTTGAFSVDNLTLQLPAQDVFTDNTGGQTIVLKQISGGFIEWSSGAAVGTLAVNDSHGLTINDLGGPDTLMLDSTGGNPLPNLLLLNGSFTVSGPLHIAATEKVVLPLSATAGANSLTVGGLKIDPGGTLDIGNGSVTVNYSGASPLSAIQAYLAGARDGGKWDGSGITSSFVASGALVRAIADVDTGSSVKLTPALSGDANLDGKVSFADLVALASSYNTSSRADWSHGDFNYDGKVDFADLVTLASNYNQSTGAAIAADAAAPLHSRRRRAMPVLRAAHG